MSTISYDGQSFSVEGRRIWLVSGAVHYVRTPRAQWRARLEAARQAGLNCIETYVFWNVHEPEPGKFDFAGERDLRAFVELIGELGMFCILRPGPYVCAEWDNGGLPAWLGTIEGMKLRQANGPFLEACSRYLGEVLAQVKDLQITTPMLGKPQRATHMNLPGLAAGGFTGSHTAGSGAGPIIMMQAENEWFSHNPEQADKYLHQIARYLRENGCEVPITICNQLWQRLDGTIDTWNASAHLATDLRQLALVQPNAPRLVSEYWTGWFDRWGGKHADTVDADKHLYRMASILASGAQYNLYMFHGGTNFGFFGGRTVGGNDVFMTTSYDYDAPLSEAGGRGPKYAATKRVSTFASQFHHVFSHLEAGRAHAAVAMTEKGHLPSVVHQRGTQGQVVFVLRAEDDKTQQVDVMLPNGLTLPVPMGTDRAAWLLLDTKLGGAAELNYTNLRPWAFLKRQMLVLFGPAGAKGLLSLNDVPIEVKVPEGDRPVVETHEGLTVVVLSGEQVDATYIHEAGLAVWSSGLDADGQPVGISGSQKMLTVALDGTVQAVDASPMRKPPAPKLGQWGYASIDTMVDGTSERYEKIDGPASLETLGQPYGYGWYKLSLGKHGNGKVMSPGARDRLHVYQGGQLKHLLGAGTGAVDGAAELKAVDEVVVLADNLGRYNYGFQVGEAKGLVNHFYSVREAKLGKAKKVSERAPDPFELTGYVPGRRYGERPPSEALVWKVKPEGRKPLVVRVEGFPVNGVLLVNDKPVALLSPGHQGGVVEVVLDPKDEHVSGGQNELKIALYKPWDDAEDVTKYVQVYQTTGNLSAKGQWHFARWQVPEAQAFGNMPKDHGKMPGWYRTSFTVRRLDVPLWFEPRGMSKGQIYLNGVNVGRYWVGTLQGEKIGPQERYYLPEGWLRTDGDNELVVFDEHGFGPGKARLVYDAMGPYG